MIRERPVRQPSAELLGQGDDDAVRVAEVTEPVAVPVLSQLADELGAMGVQAGEHILNVVAVEHDATYAQRARRCVFRLGAARPSSSMPSSAKNALAGSTSSTTTPTWSIR